MPAAATSGALGAMCAVPRVAGAAREAPETGAAGAAEAAGTSAADARPRAVRVRMASSDMAKLRAGTNRHLVDRRRVRAVDSCVEVLDSTGRSTSCARCMIACLVSAIAGVGCPGPGATLPPPGHAEDPPAGVPHSTLATDDA